MKKVLILTMLLLMAVGSVRADLMWYEGYNYIDGRIDVVSTNASSPTVPLWSRFSNGTVSDALISNHQEQVAATGGVPVGRSDDVRRFFPAAYTNSGAIPLFASFTVIVTNFPNAAGGYFALFYRCQHR